MCVMLTVRIYEVLCCRQTVGTHTSRCLPSHYTIPACHSALGKVTTLLTVLGDVAEESVLTNYPSLYTILLINLDVSLPSTVTLPRPAVHPPHLCIYEAFCPN